MALNGNALNSKALNSQAGFQPITGEGLLISIEQSVGRIESGQLVSIEQSISIIGTGELISIEQDVELRLSSTSPASFIDIEQTQRAVYSGNVFINIEQAVEDNSVPTFFDRAGWDAQLVINGYKIPREQIHGDIKIERTENDAALMDVTLIPPIGVQDLDFYHGKSITLDIKTGSGWQRAYTGTIDIPEVDLIEEKITLRCTDRRREQLNTQFRSLVNSIGVYSTVIFSKPSDVAEEVEQRLTTTPHAVDFDAYGNYTVTPWLPKSTADITLTDSDVYRDKPRVELTSRARVVNKVNVTFQYRYERFYHAERIFNWESPIADDICLLLRDGYSLTPRAMIEGAAASAGWPLAASINFTEVPSSGWYRCSLGAGFENTPIAWSTVQYGYQSYTLKDENGNVVKDEDGNNVTQSFASSGIDYGPLYCIGATWTASTQWAQTITEEHTMTFTAPQSIAQYGTITQELGYSFEDKTNPEVWEDYVSHNNTISGSYYLDQDVNRVEFIRAGDVAYRQARNIILGSHRDTRVFVNTFIRPDIDLKHTVLVDTDEVEAKGKVFKVMHTMNIGTGEARTETTLLLSRAQGSSSNTGYQFPLKPSDNITFKTQVIGFGNHFGEDPTTPAAKTWTGFVGNRWVNESGNIYRTNYSEQFIVDVPPVEAQFREAKQLNATKSYTVAIPNNTLTITFDGVS